MTARANISLSWTEGRFFDLWMLVHFMCGAAGGFSNLFLGLTVPVVFIVGLALMIVWEVVEVVVGIGESWENRTLDLVIGLLGVWAALALTPRLDHRARLFAFGASVLLVVIGEAFGWVAYRRRTQAVRNARTAG